MSSAIRDQDSGLRDQAKLGVFYQRPKPSQPVVPSGWAGGKARDLPGSEWCNDSRENLEAVHAVRSRDRHPMSTCVFSSLATVSLEAGGPVGTRGTSPAPQASRFSGEAAGLPIRALSTAETPVILVVRSDPEPQNAVRSLNAYGSIVQADSDGVDSPNLFEVQRRMPGVALQQLEVSSGYSLNLFRQLVSQLAKTTGRPMAQSGSVSPRSSSAIASAASLSSFPAAMSRSSWRSHCSQSCSVNHARKAASSDSVNFSTSRCRLSTLSAVCDPELMSTSSLDSSNALERKNHPDCRWRYQEKFGKRAEATHDASFRISTPFTRSTRARSINA
jgi:hypothetical protein